MKAAQFYKIYFSIQDYLMILFGTLLYGFGFNAFILSNEIVTGGVSGICALIFFATGGAIPVSVSYFVINVVLLLAALKILGFKFLIKTIFGVFSLSASLSFFEWLLKGNPILHDQPFMAIMIGALLCGAGLGLVFSTGYSTGGTDLLSSILHKYMPQVPIARILFCLDAAVIAAGIFTFGSHSAAYAVFAVFLSSKVMDLILTGVRAGKQIWIISEEYQKIGSQILEELHRGVTSLDGRGVYSNRKKNVLVCLASAREIARILQIVEKNDDNAFVFIQDVKEIMGEGFVKIGK